jgi:hypothetical protein
MNCSLWLRFLFGLSLVPVILFLMVWIPFRYWRFATIRWIAAHLKRRDICGEDGTLYLSRYRVLGWMPGSRWRLPFSIYLHRIHRADLDPAPHNHPWKWARSLILHGQYLEVREHGDATSYEWLRPGRVNRINESDFHCIASVQGEVWTLFIVGPRCQSWGFKVPGRGFTPWRDRLRERGIDPSY